MTPSRVVTVYIYLSIGAHIAAWTPQLWNVAVACSANLTLLANGTIKDFSTLAGGTPNVAGVPYTAYKFSPQYYLLKENRYHMWR